ncbi:MAG: UvrD-helicase domain-containing protein [Candidatus Rokubacteria bacterium]|nr:UvrD-helicase domain-containing protein [Candidatus Rokubacteria bacterium]
MGSGASTPPARDDPAIARILEGLNPAQIAGVTHDHGPLLIVAGAGTGKTTVLTRRIAYLIATRRARPEDILALTFTDKAAAEMEERVDVLVPYGYADVRISTFHAFGDWLLRENALEVGLTPAFRVLNRAEQVLFLRSYLFELPLDQYRPLGDPTRHLQALIALFGRAKDEDISPEEYRAYAEAVAAEAAARPDDVAGRDRAARALELARTYAAYQALMAREGVIDFGDQIVYVLRLFRARPYVLDHYQRRFRYVLVDEFQDTNYAQFELVKLLGARHRNVTVVGDDDQAIFRFRGASMRNILGFDRAYPDARRVVLAENYRSGQRLLDAAYRLIRYNDPDRLEVAAGIDKRLASVHGPGPEPVHLPFETVTQEADAVAAKIAALVATGDYRYGDVAILVRSNNDAEPFLRSLNMREIPWTFSGNEGLYGRPEVRLLIAVLRVIAHPDDAVSLFHLAASPLYGVPPVDLIRCNTYADRRNRWLFDVLRGIDELPEMRDGVSAEGAEAVRRLTKDLERYMTLAAELPAGELLYRFLEDSGWLARMSKAASAREEAEVQNIAKFFRRLQEATGVLRSDRVREFVNHLDALIEAGEDPAVAEAEVDVPAVHVLTVHKAKGLEFPVVFVVGLVQGRFPWPHRSDVLELPDALIKDPPPSGDVHLQEERRLCYVAMTRARQALYLTSARDYGGKRERKTSQFVLEALDLPRDAAWPSKSTALEEIRRAASPRHSGDWAFKEEPPLPPDAPLELSHRQVDDYQTCPLKYRYIHLLRVPIRRHHSVVYGEALHRVVEHYLRRRAAGLYTPLQDLLDVFEREWRNEGFLTWAHEAARKQAGCEAITRFWHEEEASGAKPAHVEREFGFNLGPDRVRGRWDRVDEADGEAVIIDYKSSDVREAASADARAAESLQLKLYALAWRAMFGQLPARVELRFLESGVVGRHVPTADDARGAVEAVREAAAGIRARRFAATPSYQACRFCAYNQICPYTASGD